MFSTMSDVLLYLPAYRAYHWQMLQEMYDDNIMYSEVRMNMYEVGVPQSPYLYFRIFKCCCFFFKLYDANNNTFTGERCLLELMHLVAQFRQQHPDFLGIKIIISPSRNTAPEGIQQRFDNFKMYQ